MSALPRWPQLIDATLYLKRQDGVSAYEARIWSRVQYGGEDGVVGPLAVRGVVEIDWAGVWQALIVNLFPTGAARRHPPRATTPIPASVKPFGTRGDIQRHCGGTIDTIDGQVAGPLTIDGEP